MINSPMIFGILFLISILIMAFCGFNAIIFMITFSIFILIAIFNVFSIYKKNSVEKSLEDAAFDIGTKILKEKKYFKSMVYFLSYPMCFVGILFIIISMVCMWIKTLV